MSSPIEQNRERVSALMDGQLHSQEFADAVHAACDDADAQESWGTYHLIGDVLRGDPAAQRHASSDFVARLQVRLLAERIALAPVADVVAEPGGALHAPSRQSAATEKSLRELIELANSKALEASREAVAQRARADALEGQLGSFRDLPAALEAAIRSSASGPDTRKSRSNNKVAASAKGDPRKPTSRPKPRHQRTEVAE